jgi:hypothetical protein
MKNFLRVAIGIQEIPYSGLRVKDSTLIATNGYCLVAYKASPFTVRGEGMLHPLTLQALLVYADILDDYDALQVDGNKATLKVKLNKYDAQFFTLPPLDCPVKQTENIFNKLDRAQIIVCDLPAKRLLPADAGGFVKVGRGGLLPATEEDDWRYSAKQIRKCAEMFRARDELMISVSPEGLLKVENEWGHLFVVTPFRKPQQS